MPEKKNYFPIIINNAIAYFEDPAGLDRPLCRDYSKHQGYVNYDVSVSLGVQLAAIRAGISWGYIDPYFNYNWNGSQGRMRRTSYHVLYPSEDVVKQADKVWYKAQPELDVLPRVIDLEVSTNSSSKQIADQTWKMSELVLARDGCRPWIYSRYKLVEKWLHHWTQDMLNAHYWWFAQYSWYGFREHAGPPTLPKRIDGSIMVERENVIMQQTSDHKLAPPGEVQSKSVDWDRWELGNELQMHAWIEEKYGGGTTPPPIEPPEEEIIERVKITANALNVRSEPNASSTDLGELIHSSVVPIVERDGLWKRIGAGWIHGDWTTPV